MSGKAMSDKASVEKRELTPMELAEVKTGRRIGGIHQAPGYASRRRVMVAEGGACYHVMSRTAGGEFLFGDLEKEAFRKMMWRLAEFTGVEILTYALMDNHFHLLVKVPQREKWLRRFDGEDGEEKLLDHLSTLYSKAFVRQVRNEIDTLRKQSREKEVTVLLDRFKRRFCDLSLFVKELKERFSRWFNKVNGRRGTLWMDRFKSILVEDGDALRVMAAYIDLNPVRAGLVTDPADFRWTGYGEAMRGSRRAKRGLCKIVGAPQDSWDTRAGELYRCWLYEEGVSVPEKDTMTGGVRPKLKQGFTVKKMTEVKNRASVRLCQRISALTNGIALGSESFVDQLGSNYREERGRKQGANPKIVDSLQGEEGNGSRDKWSFFSLRR